MRLAGGGSLDQAWLASDVSRQTPGYFRARSLPEAGHMFASLVIYDAVGMWKDYIEGLSHSTGNQD